MAQRSMLDVISNTKDHVFTRPVKRIYDGADVSFFHSSLAYKDLMTFILQLNHSMVPRVLEQEGSRKIQRWESDSDALIVSDQVRALQQLISQLDSLIDEVPPDTGPRRFGNISFRKWYKLVDERLVSMLSGLLPGEIVRQDQAQDAIAGATALDEVREYLMGSFGSAERLDYGTGHELSFMAFLASLWKLGCFQGQNPGDAERSIVIRIFQPYLHLSRRLIQIYTLEPAGSHGVWGLDDNSFLPYIFGSAQLAPAIRDADPIPIEGSLPEAPDVSSVTDRSLVHRERVKNMYFSAVGFIYDVKRGPFGEHSPMLYDISGITSGWGKVNKGMIKMYNVEVLSKFPVVQHFPFGSILRWERDPDANTGAPVSTSAPHITASQPLRETPLSTTSLSAATSRSVAGHHGSLSAETSISAPRAAAPPPPSKPPVGMVDGVTRAPWASTTKPPPPPPPPTADRRNLGR